MNIYESFLKENNFSKKFVDKIMFSNINNKTTDTDLIVSTIYKWNNYLRNGLLERKLCNVSIYEFPFDEDETSELSLLYSFKELCINDLLKLLFRKNVFLKDEQQLLGGQLGIIEKIINSIEIQSQIKLIIITKIDIKTEIFTHIYIKFSLENL